MKNYEGLKGSQDEKDLSALMRLAQGGDGKAYNELLVKVQKMLQSFVRKSVPEDHVEDVIQEIILAIHKKRSTFNPEQYFLPWFYAIARYKVIDHIRAKVRRRTISFTAEEFDQLTVLEVEPLLTHISSEDFNLLLEELPEKQKQAIRSVKIEGLSVKETAQKLGFTESDVKVTVHRALKTLKAKFQGGLN